MVPITVAPSPEPFSGATLDSHSWKTAHSILTSVRAVVRLATAPGIGPVTTRAVRVSHGTGEVSVLGMADVLSTNSHKWSLFDLDEETKIPKCTLN